MEPTLELNMKSFTSRVCLAFMLNGDLAGLPLPEAHLAIGVNGRGNEKNIMSHLSDQKQFQKINLGDSVKIPSSVATCPECWSQLLAEVVEYENLTGHVTEGGMYIKCDNAYDPAENPKGLYHELNFDDWDGIIIKVWNWVWDNVRVIDEKIG